MVIQYPVVNHVHTSNIEWTYLVVFNHTHITHAYICISYIIAKTIEKEAMTELERDNGDLKVGICERLDKKDTERIKERKQKGGIM